MYDHPAVRNIMGILLVLSGAAGLAVLVLMFITGINYADAPFLAVALSVLLLLIWSVLYIICGVLSIGPSGRGRAFKLTVAVQLCAIAAFVQIIFSGICGFYAAHLCMLAAAGIVVPELFIVVICTGSKLRPKLR